MAIRIGIVDDHPFLSRGVMALLGSRPEFEPVWAEHEPEGAWQALVSQPVDVALIDVKLGAEPLGLDLLKRVTEAGLSVRCLMFSSYCSERIVRESHRYGAVGFLSKADEIEDLAEAILAAAAGSKEFLGRFGKWAQPNVLLELSPREAQVLRELARGRKNQEMARILGLSLGTIKKHLESIYFKLGARSRSEAIRLGLTKGYFFADELAG